MDPVENRDYCQTYCGRGDNHRYVHRSSRQGVENADISAEDVDIIIAATVSADKHLPGLACEVQKNIGAENAVAFDINAACSGFLFALDTAALYLEHGGYQHALVIGAETLSK